MIEVVVPSNFSFVNDDTILPKLLLWQEKFTDIRI
jgi:hypothetical protein